MRIPLRSLPSISIVLALSAGTVRAQNRPDSLAAPLLLVPDAVWDGVSPSPRPGWVVLVQKNRIQSVGPAGSVAAPDKVERMELPGTTLIPGLIEGHS
ncbi:MAG: hypothetical protein ACJ8A6_08360, partial [Gemmatimonadales bacterium]